MSRTQRTGVSIEADLLEQFDELIRRQGYENRSEAIRDMIREKLSRDKLRDPAASAMAAVLVVYDHHHSNLSKKLNALQHSHLLDTICSMHVHMDHHNCLEVIILRGKVADIEQLGHHILSIRGVKLGKVNLISSD